MKTQQTEGRETTRSARATEMGVRWNGKWEEKASREAREGGGRGTCKWTRFPRRCTGWLGIPLVALPSVGPTSRSGSSGCHKRASVFACARAHASVCVHARSMPLIA